jgi:hypothetical protein
MSWVGNTRQLPTQPEEPDWYEPQRTPGGALGWFTGVVTSAVVLLALLVGGAKVLGNMKGFAGPPADEVVAHIAGAVGAIVLQAGVRRGRWPLKMLATLALLALTAALLWFYWYS